MKCPNCSGTLYFNVKDQKLKCKHCSQTFEVDEYEPDAAAEELIFEDAKVYTCKNCGAELISGDATAVTYCSYCGSEAIVEGNLHGVRKPKYIIPFKITKEKCKAIYNKELKNKLYVPKEFKDPEFINRFRAFYIPYWLYQIKFREDPFELKGHKNYTRGNYDYHEEYEITASVKDKGIYGIPYDASRNFDDSIAENIAPFKRTEIRSYKPAYLAGMYADSPNVDAELYKDEVVEKATETAISDIKEGTGMVALDLPSKPEKLQKLLQTRYESADAIFLPVWFLTWKKNDRVAYAIVNGQTGRIHIDLPTDMPSFMMYTAIGAVMIFAILSLFVTVTSRFVLWFTALLVYLVSLRYRSELKDIRDRENHIFDKGYLLNDEDELPMSEEARERERKRAKRELPVGLHNFLMAFGTCTVMFFFIMLGLLYDILVTQRMAIVMTFVILILQIVSFIRLTRISSQLRKKRSFLFNILSLAAVGYSFFVAVTEPVQDWWYYLGALICLAAATLMCADLIARYNETATRPLPSFYTREGGNDGAKDM